jgi:DNA-binding PadR family transcriptional regulator
LKHQLQKCEGIEQAETILQEIEKKRAELDQLKNIKNKYELKEATLYSAFRRLEQSGYISSYWGDEGIGARRRYYTITQEGRLYYAQSRQDWEEAKIIIDRLI